MTEPNEPIVIRESGQQAQLGRVQAWWARVPNPARFFILILLVSLLPAAVSSDYIVRVGVNTMIYALLALGLNVVVGWSGLLDLGYVAFFGFGAYMYAILSSDQFHIHWPAVASIPLIVVAAALLGILIGLPSRRLLGDYLAILTLFFGQAFVTLVSNADRITPPGFSSPVNFTGGPIGINGVDNIHSFGFTISLGPGLLLPRPGRLHDRRSVALLAEQVADGPGVAVAARGPAGGAADGDAGEPAQAPRLHARRRRRGPHRDALRGDPGRGVPRQLRARAADHDLRDGDPRRRRKHDRGDHRRDRRQRRARDPPHSRSGALGVLRRDRRHAASC